MNFSEKLKAEFSGKKVLLLQGPVGPFFTKLAARLRKFDAKVLKINYTGGDFFFYPTGFRCKLEREKLSQFYKDYFAKHEIKAVLMYNDCRFIHSEAIKVAREMGVEIWVFEEGYLRPYCISFEKNGVNANSQIPRDKNFYLGLNFKGKTRLVRTLPGCFKYMGFYAFLYWLFSFLLAPFFNNKLHHRTLNPLECLIWARSLFLKAKYKLSEKRLYDKIYSLNKKYFLAILQVHSDTQIKFHYKKSIEHFIEETILSFANHARAKSYLVFKHHPMDRGYKNYAKLITNLSEKYHVEGRILYIHDGYLPTLISKALGCITINSTVGLTAILEGCATKVCGDAFYNFEGLVYTRKIHFFWKEASNFKPNLKLIENFRNYLLSTNQSNGNFYKSEFLDEEKDKICF